MLVIVAARVLDVLLMWKVAVAAHLPFDVAINDPEVNPVKIDPDGFVTPFNVTLLPSLLVNTTDPVEDPQVVVTIELAVKVTRAGLVKTYGPPLIEQLLASVTVTV